MQGDKRTKFTRVPNILYRCGLPVFGRCTYEYMFYIVSTQDDNIYHGSMRALAEILGCTKSMLINHMHSLEDAAMVLIGSKKTEILTEKLWKLNELVPYGYEFPVWYNLEDAIDFASTIKINVHVDGQNNQNVHVDGQNNQNVHVDGQNNVHVDGQNNRMSTQMDSSVHVDGQNGKQIGGTQARTQAALETKKNRPLRSKDITTTTTTRRSVKTQKTVQKPLEFPKFVPAYKDARQQQVWEWINQVRCERGDTIPFAVPSKTDEKQCQYIPLMASEAWALTLEKLRDYWKFLEEYMQEASYIQDKTIKIGNLAKPENYSKFLKSQKDKNTTPENKASELGILERRSYFNWLLGSPTEENFETMNQIDPSIVIEVKTQLQLTGA